MQEVISRETVALPANSHLLTEQPVFIIDPASQFYGSDSNEFYDFIEFCKENISAFGEDQEALGKYLQFLTMISSQYLDSSYFREVSDKKTSLTTLSDDGPKHLILFKTSFLKTLENNSLYRPMGFNMMMRLICAGNPCSADFFRSGYNFFLPVKKESPFNCFDLCNPYLCYVRFGNSNDPVYHQVLIKYDQTFGEDGMKELVQKRFEIFCSLIEVFEKIKKYEEYLRGLNKDQYPLVILSYEERHLLKIDQSIEKVKKDFEKISEEIPSLNLDLRKLNPSLSQQSDEQQDQRWSSLFFVNPYFLLLKFGQVMDQLNQKFIDEISDLDSSKPNYSISCDVILKTLILRNYSQLKSFFYNRQLPLDIFSIKITKIDDLFRDYKWLSTVFKHFYEFLDANCLESSYKKFPEAFAPTILNFIAYCADAGAFDIALESGVSLRSLEHSKVLELVLIGSKQNEKENILRVLLTYLNYGGDLEFLNKKSISEFIENIDQTTKDKFEKYKTVLVQFTQNLKKFSSKRTKLEDRKKLLKEFIAVSELYLQSFDPKDYPHTNPENHNILLLEKFNREFSVFKCEDVEVSNIKITSLLNFAGFIEYLIGNGVIDYCFKCKTEDVDFKKDLELFKENISKLLMQFSKRNSFHQHFADLSTVDLEKSLFASNSKIGKSLKRELVAIELSGKVKQGGESLEEEISPEVEKLKVEESSKKPGEELVTSKLDKVSSSDAKESAITIDHQKFSQSCQEIYDRNHSLFLDIFNQVNIQDTVTRFSEIHAQIEDSEKQVFVRSVYGYANMASLVIGEDFEHPLIVKAKELSNFLEREFPDFINSLELHRDSGWSEVPLSGSLATKQGSKKASKLQSHSSKAQI